MIFLLLRPDPQQIGALIDAEAPADSTASADSTVSGVSQGADGDHGRDLRSLLPVLSRRIVQFSLLALVIGQLVMTLLMVITPLHMHHHNHDNTAVAWVIAAHNLGMFGLSGLTGFLIDRLGRIPMIGAGALVLIISSVMTPISADFFLLATALFLLGLGWNFSFIAASSLLADALESHERGRIQGVSETLIALAAGASSLGSGGAFALGGIIAVAAVGLAFSLLLLSAIFWFERARTVEMTR
jgi:MFS family permease